jgi:hypothetical protein
MEWRTSKRQRLGGYLSIVGAAHDSCAVLSSGDVRQQHAAGAAQGGWVHVIAPPQEWWRVPPPQRGETLLLMTRLQAATLRLALAAAVTRPRLLDAGSLASGRALSRDCDMLRNIGEQLQSRSVAVRSLDELRAAADDEQVAVVELDQDPAGEFCAAALPSAQGGVQAAAPLRICRPLWLVSTGGCTASIPVEVHVSTYDSQLTSQEGIDGVVFVGVEAWCARVVNVRAMRGIRDDGLFSLRRDQSLRHLVDAYTRSYPLNRPATYRFRYNGDAVTDDGASLSGVELKGANVRWDRHARRFLRKSEPETGPAAKRGKTSFSYFCDEYRSKHERKVTQKVLGRAWAKMSDAEKQPYHRLADPYGTPDDWGLMDGDVINVSRVGGGGGGGRGLGVGDIGVFESGNTARLGYELLLTAAADTTQPPVKAVRDIIWQLGGRTNSRPSHCLLYGALPSLSARRALMGVLDTAHRNCRGVAASADVKVDLCRVELERLVGLAAVRRLASLFAEPFNEIKLRRTEAVKGGRGAGQCIAFHLDHSERTMQVPLNDPTDYEGGRLVYAVGDGRLESPPRDVGTATIHDDGIVHGVTPLRRGVRYALFLLRVPV